MSSASGGERDLERLIRGLTPRLSAQRFVFEEAESFHLQDDCFALIREEEGITAIRQSAVGQWARITLDVHSNLEAVGLTAVVSRSLADVGISANIIAGLRHDHIFVPWDRRHEAIAVLSALSGEDSALA